MLEKKALLANLTIKVWSGVGQDKEVSKEIETEKEVKAKGRYIKTLIFSDELKQLKKCALSARYLFYSMTLPWGDNGDRLLPVDRFFEFTHKMKEAKNEFNEKRMIFLNKYVGAIGEAKEKLGSFFKEDDYPMMVDGKFNFDINLSPIPHTDFRVDLDDDTTEGLEEDFMKSMDKRTEGAKEALCASVEETLCAVINTLRSEDGRKKNVLKRVRQCGEKTGMMNVFGNRMLDEISEDMMKMDGEINNDVVAATKADEVQTIVNKLNSMRGFSIID